MNHISIKKAMASNLPRRKRAYVHKAGRFVLTANFRDPQVDQASVRLNGFLSKVFTQAVIAEVMGVGIGVVGKLVRIWKHHNP